MYWKLIIFLSFLLGMPASACAARFVERGAWQPQKGDIVVIDTANTKGYFVHPDASYTTIDVLTGQRRTVRYLHQTYDATTPEAEWVAKEKVIQGDRLTFGDGRFFRLYKNGTAYTSYGIHGHAYSAKMLASANHFRSMGCIILGNDDLDLFERTFEFNNGELPVITSFGTERAVSELNKRDQVALQ